MPEVGAEFFRYELRAVRRKPRRKGALPKSARTGDVAAFVFDLVRGEPVEVFGAVYFDRDGRPVGYTMPYRGQLQSVSPERRHLLLKALLCEAGSLTVFHNHPMAKVAGPSDADRLWTEAFLAMSAPLGLMVRDHLVLADEPSYFSMAEKGTVRGLGWKPGDLWSLEEHARRFERGRRAAGGEGRQRRRKATPKYRDPATGQTWAGRGTMAKWLKRRLEEGHELEEFAVDQEEEGRAGRHAAARLD